MGETVHIGEMAEKLSDEVFSEFLWQKVGPTNQNWDCQLQERHGVKTHPADVVFFYDEPYQARRTYVHCDLKSYGKGSIKTSQIKKALESLAKQIECAERSEDWQRLYTHRSVTPQIVGLLFVYNHDKEYDQDFNKLIISLNARKINIPVGSRIYLFGPDDIHWINNVRTDIQILRGSGKLPDQAQCRFFYPHTVRQTNIRPETARSATLDMLSSPWITLESQDKSNTGRKSITLYYRREASGVDEFLYLLDYFRHFQLLEENISIHVRVLPSNTEAKGFFQKSCTEYIERTLSENEQLSKIIGAIKFSEMTQIVSTFSEKQLGMSYDHS